MQQTISNDKLKDHRTIQPKRPAPSRTALVTGASSGIGLATVRLLASQGWTVYAASRTIDSQMGELFPEPELRRQIHPVTLDIQDEAACRLVIHRLLESGTLDALVHCAGAGIAGAIAETSLDEAAWQFDNLLFGTLRVVQAVLPHFHSQRAGRIVLVSSVAAMLPIPFQTYYSAAKAAVNAYAFGLADEVRPVGIKVCVIAPGDTRTGFTDARRTAPPHPQSPYRERLARSVARMAHDEQHGMHPDQIARAIVRQLGRAHPALLVTPGWGYQAITLLARILPLRLVRSLVRLLYA